MHTTKKLIKTQADFKGMKLNAGDYVAFWVEGMGGTPVFVPFEDSYMTLEKGIVEGHLNTFGWMMGSGSIELCHYHTVLPVLVNPVLSLFVMNPDSWSKLPPDLQKLFTDSNLYTDIRTSAEMGAETAGVEMRKAAGDTFYDLPAAEMDTWMAVAKTIHMKWVDKNGAAGQRIYDELQKVAYP